MHAQESTFIFRQVSELKIHLQLTITQLKNDKILKKNYFSEKKAEPKSAKETHTRIGPHPYVRVRKEKRGKEKNLCIMIFLIFHSPT